MNSDNEFIKCQSGKQDTDFMEKYQHPVTKNNGHTWLMVKVLVLASHVTVTTKVHIDKV